MEFVAIRGHKVVVHTVKITESNGVYELKESNTTCARNFMHVMVRTGAKGILRAKNNNIPWLQGIGMSWCKIQVKNFFTEQQHILQKNEIQGLVICPPIILEHAFQ